jgi:hypothetical protein
MNIQEDIKTIIENCIDKSFEILQELYRNKTSDKTRMRIPQYRGDDNNTRVSEQELRFLFVETICKNESFKEGGYSFSVETPTKDIYKFTENGKTLQKPKRGEGQSANFDLTISNGKGELIVLIEFKAKNTKPSLYAKDFCKLWNPEEGKPNALRYFVNVLDKADKNTSVKIKEKLEKIKKDTYKKDDANIHLIFRALECGTGCENPIIEEVI